MFQSIDGHAGQPADNPPNSDGLVVYHWTVPELMVWVSSQPGKVYFATVRFAPGIVANTMPTTGQSCPVIENLLWIIIGLQ